MLPVHANPIQWVMLFVGYGVFSSCRWLCPLGKRSGGQNYRIQTRLALQNAGQCAKDPPDVVLNVVSLNLDNLVFLNHCRILTTHGHDFVLIFPCHCTSLHVAPSIVPWSH
ncbi:hypothetical protein GQ55_5G128400 [Panicum hallii var. hallii]|uniref:Uncharacterized protein n=1 Tax=Panicum hallii var. hallii TaxID=1504633 RepID=A0A2T7DFM7_9POAL|nr:hypothetical protein GQ55_5G128400 [Panicum hallii var. hallii]